MNVKCRLAGGALGHVTEERGHLAAVQDHRIGSLSASLMQKLVAHLKVSVTKATASGSQEFLNDRGC